MTNQSNLHPTDWEERAGFEELLTSEDFEEPHQEMQEQVDWLERPRYEAEELDDDYDEEDYDRD